MGLFDRISRIVRANVNDMVNKAEDPEKVLEQSIVDMQEDLVQLRQAVASAIATDILRIVRIRKSRRSRSLIPFVSSLVLTWIFLVRNTMRTKRRRKRSCDC